MAEPFGKEVTVATAGTRVQISTDDWHVLSITFIAAVGNSGIAYFGDVTVSATIGFPLEPGDAFTDSPSQALQDTNIPHSTLLSDYYVDVATSGDKVAYFASVVK